MRHNGVFRLAKDIVVCFCGQHTLRDICLGDKDRALGLEELDQVGIKGGWVEAAGNICITRVESLEMEAFLWGAMLVIVMEHVCNIISRKKVNSDLASHGNPM